VCFWLATLAVNSTSSTLLDAGVVAGVEFMEVGGGR
jgi:hypothetical protein